MSQWIDGEWLGVPGYAAAHRRLHKARGRAADNACVDCGQKATQWSYDGQDPDELSDLTVTGKPLYYSLDHTRYHPRCTSCHKKFDAPDTCGTTKGARRHYANKTKPCQPCLEAARQYQREWRARAKESTKDIPRQTIPKTNPTADDRCGTYGGYTAHGRRNEHSCEACREAAQTYWREYKRRTA